MPSHYRYTLAFLLWMAFVAYSCLASFSGDEVSHIDIPHLDKAVHFVFYFVAAILGMLAFRERFGKENAFGRALLIVVGVVIIYGIIIEVLQYELTSDREGDILDALANSLGAFCGAWLIKILFSRNGRLKWKN